MLLAALVWLGVALLVARAISSAGVQADDELAAGELVLRSGYAQRRV